MATIAEQPIERGNVQVREVVRKLGLGALVGLIFFSVSGGPYGLEDTIGEAGAGMGLLLIVLTPLLWSLPTALMVAELGTALPVQGGYYHWVKTGLGRFWGFQEGWWSWVTSWVDLALYPVLFVDYAAYFFPVLSENQMARWLVCLVVIWGFAYLNMRGTALVGDSSKLFLVIVLAPFALVTIIGLFHMHQNPFQPFTPEDVGPLPAFGAGLFVIMWNYMGWDGISTCAGEMENPRRDYPRALAITIPLITLIYLVPTVISLAVVGTNDVEWTAGAYNVVAEMIAGKWLGTLLTITALFSAVGLYAAWLLQYSRIPFALSEDGYLPKQLAKLHPSWGTPIWSITIAAAICSLAALGPFQALVVVDVTIYAGALMLEFAALVVLRIKYPTLRRPYKIPGGWPVIALVVFFPAAITVIAVYYQVLDVGWAQGFGWAAIGLLSGFIVYPILLRAKKKSGLDENAPLEFEDAQPEPEVTG